MRSYRQYCAAARALDVIGSRWTLLIIRELLLGPRRYSDLREALPGITTNLLAARLRAMTRDGLIRRGQGGYQLAAAGAALEPVLLALAQWGMRRMDRPRRGERVDFGWMLLASKLWYPGGLDLELELRSADHVYQLRILPDRMLVQERAATAPAAIATAPPLAFAALVGGAARITDLRRSGVLRVTGDPRAFTRAIAALRRGRKLLSSRARSHSSGG